MLLLLFFAAVATGAEETKMLRIATWNLQWFPGGKPGADKDTQDRHILQVREEIQRIAPDILLLQEVGSLAALEETLKPLGDHWKVAVVSRFKQGNFLSGQQIAIAARIPAESAWAENWNASWAGPPRGFAYASFLINGKRLAVYSLHLKSNLGNPVENTSKREDSMEQLIAHLGTPSDRMLKADAVVIGGDFNTDDPNTLAAPSPGEITFGLLRKAGFQWSFQGVPHSERITCPAKGSYPPACFDYFFTKGLGHPVSSVRNAVGSDHFPVVIEVEM